MSDTPKTDYLKRGHPLPNKSSWADEVLESHATLERENNELREALKVCAEAVNESIHFCSDVKCQSGKPHHANCRIAKREAALALPAVQQALEAKS